MISVKYWCVLTVVENYFQLLTNEKIHKNNTKHQSFKLNCKKIEIRNFTGSDGDNFQNTFIKLRLHEQFFTRDHNAIFRNYCIAVARKKLHV